MFKWSDLGRLREYLLIGLKRGMPWRVLASTFSDRLEHEVTGLDKTSKKQANLKYEIINENEKIATTRKNIKNFKNMKNIFGTRKAEVLNSLVMNSLVNHGQSKRYKWHIANVSITPVIIIIATELQWSCCRFLLVIQEKSAVKNEKLKRLFR